MKKQIIFDNQIILWWEKTEFAYNKEFSCFINGKFSFKTDKTYAEFNALTANTEYEIKILSDLNAVVFEGKIKTAQAKRKIDVTQSPYNAIGDGQTMNTEKLQKALNDCDENHCVYLPEGVYKTGALRIPSNVELYLEEGAVLQGTDKVEDYLPKIKSRFEGIEMLCYSALLNMGEMDSKSGANCQNIVIRGGGKIVGGGLAHLKNVVAVERELMRKEMEALGEKIKECETPDTIPARARPRLINVSNGENIVISNVSIENGPAWNLHILYSENIIVHGCCFKSSQVWNGDGCDPDSSENVAIFKCIFETGDDCIAIKSGKNPQGNIINRKCSNIYVFDCKGSGHGIALGSEMSGGIEKVYIWDCDIGQTQYGLHIKATRKRGGYIRDVHVFNSVLPFLLIRSVPYNDDGESANALPIFADFYLKDCVIKGKKVDALGTYERRHIVIQGFGEDGKIKNVYLDNVDVQLSEEDTNTIHVEYAENINLGL